MTLDSNEELYFVWWLEELKQNGYVIDFTSQIKFDLSAPLITKWEKSFKRKGPELLDETIMNPHIYTTDFSIIWAEKAIGIFTIPIDSKLKKKGFLISQYGINGLYSFIEVKPLFDQNNMTRLAKINIKWVWHKYNQFVNIVVPEKLFEKTFTPKRFLLTNLSGQGRKIKYKNVITLENFISSHIKQM